MPTPSPTDSRGDPGSPRSVGGPFRFDARGETSLEYGLIASLVVLALITALPVFQTASSRLYNRISNAMVATGQ